MAEHRHKRDTDARRKPRAATVAAPLALLATASAVTLGVLASGPVTGTILAQDSASADLSPVAGRHASKQMERPLDLMRDRKIASRSEGRLARTSALEEADTRLWTAIDLNLWTAPGRDAKQDGEIKAGKRVLVTGRQAGDREEVLVEGQLRWVTAGHLAAEKPVAAPAGLSMAPCPDPGVENGLTANAVYVYRSVCHAFPQITSYGGWDAHGEHSSGKALDIMTSDVTLGNAIADFLKAHASELKLYDILWRQQIWTPVRAGEGWRTFPSRGSATANHFDHVHVSTY
ncbi:mucin-2 protein [Nocardioides conyzicola]|uniref:ARB-07466-like C-terminal domain-containing protein n=1 Tax=Nocardioides conyzicola TaxID=1651781 RepID=A0ABP8WTQ3_9ACTN